MSLHYEWTLSLSLRTDTPDSFLAELRYHLGEAAAPPAEPELDWEHPAFTLDGDDALPGGAVLSLREQAGALGLYIRTMVLDDDMYELIQTVPGWLARWSATRGWIGFAREELAREPWLYFYAQDGHAYLAGPGEYPSSVDAEAPPFAGG